MWLKIRVLIFASLLIGATLLCVQPALAGMGKITGAVIDADTKDPIMGANVTIEGTQQGAPTDLEGGFIIISLQPGKYDVKVTAVGYSTVRQTGVLVQSDLTTKLDFQMKPTVLEAADTITVVYEKPQVILDQTSNSRIMSAQDLSSMVVNNLSDAIARQTGFTIDAEGNIHARGGRAEETLFVLDGIDLRDPLVDSKVNFDLSSLNIEELQVLTGGFNAEYGKAQSAIINVTTREGEVDRYTGQAKYTTDNLINNTSFNTDRTDLSLGGPIPMSKSLLGKPITFFFSGSANLTDTYTPFDQSRSANDYMDAGIKLPERTSNEYNASMKLAYQLTGNKKLTLTANEFYHKWDLYPDGEGDVGGDYGWQYRYNTQNRPWALNKRGQMNLNFTHQISQKSFYEVQVGRFATHSFVRPGGGLDPGDFTLADSVEDDLNIYSDANGDGIIDAANLDNHIPFAGFVDANLNGVYDGSGEGYEDLNGNGVWDQGEDWVDLNANGRYDYAEAWIDRINPDTGENNVGVFDPWDDYTDQNNNGVWDGDEPQLPEQDWNHNGSWDGERFWDADQDGVYDGPPPGQLAEGYYDGNLNGRIDRKMNFRDEDDTGEPFYDGDYYHDTGEPYIDTPNANGFYNGHWDPGEIFFDLPSSYTNPLQIDFIYETPTLNGIYDGPNSYFDEYELFTRFADLEFGYDASMPVLYTFDPSLHGADWPSNFWLYNDQESPYTGTDYSTWYNLKDIAEQSTSYQSRLFNPPNYLYDQGEPFTDYNGSGAREGLSRFDGIDHFLNPGQWDQIAYWQDRSTLEYSTKVDFTSQVSKHHEVKAGGELKYREMQMQSIERPDLPYTNTDVPLPAGSPWPDRGQTRDFYDQRPYEGALYAQDKMEFEGLIVNAGLRCDFIIHDRNMVARSEEQVISGEPGALLAKRGTYQIAPRLGISHPITDRSKLYFNYGHFYQTPQFQYLFRSNTANLVAGSKIGNPNLKLEKTVQYALGVETQVTDDLTFRLEGYYKDIYGLVSTVRENLFGTSGAYLERYANRDYGRVRGFEVSIDNDFSRNFQLSVKWDFSYAYGKASSELAEQIYRLGNASAPANRDEHPLAWDETHKINIYGTFIYQKGQHPSVLGLKLPDSWLLTLEWRYGSGEPYTPSRWTTGLPDNQITENSVRYPWHETSNLKFEKYFSLRGNTQLVAGVQVENLFNSRNIRQLYAETGNAYDSTHPDNWIDADSESYPGPFDVGTDYDHNPRNYEPPRQILFSLGVTF